MTEENKGFSENGEVLKEKNTPALLGFIFSFFGPLAFAGLILSIVGVATAKKYKKTRKGLAIAGIVISAIVLLIFATTSNTPKKVDTSSPGGSQTTTTESVYKIGDTIKYKKYEITIENVTTKNRVGGKYFNSTPAEGGIYVCVDFKYKNISDEPMSFVSFPSVYLVDAKGTRYSSDISASTYYATEKDPDRKVLSDLNPGITVQDNEVYEISKDLYNSGEWYLLVDNKVRIKVK